jgi:hypothetical protein
MMDLRKLIFALPLLLNWDGLRAASNEPYIDQLRKELPSDVYEKLGPEHQSYSESIRKQLREQDSKEAGKVFDPSLSYTDVLRQHLDREAESNAVSGQNLEALDTKDSNSANDSYSAKEALKLGQDQSPGAIEALQKGTSDLELKRKGDIHFAYGFRYAVTGNRTASNPLQKRTFESVYGSSYVPELVGFFEYQTFHSEHYGSIGVFGQTGVTFFSGKGQFSTVVNRPGGLGTFPTESEIKFKFFVVPVTLGLNSFFEMRNDDIRGSRGYTKALTTSVGVSILLDGLSRQSSWELYQSHGIKQYYLTVDYTRLSTLAGAVHFDFSAFSAGLTFEY